MNKTELVAAIIERLDFLRRTLKVLLRLSQILLQSS